MDNNTVKAITEVLKAAIDASIAFEQQPTHVVKTRDGWAAYKGHTRITKYYFSEEGAREAGITWDASDVKVQF